jgi:hypothetical protein
MDSQLFQSIGNLKVKSIAVVSVVSLLPVWVLAE